MMQHNGFTVSDIQEKISQSLYHQMFKPEVLSVNNDNAELVIRMHMCPQFERQPGTNQWHGGVLASIVDISGCYALILVAKGPLLTLDFSTDFLRLAESESLIAKASVSRIGQRVGFVDVTISDEHERLFAKGRACFSILPELA